MKHQDHLCRGTCRTHADDLFRVLGSLTASVNWTSIRTRAECTWSPRLLAFAALLWAWSDEHTLTDRFRIARKVICRCICQQEQPATSYQAFVKLLRKWTEPLRALLTEAFREQIRSSLEEVWKVAGWVVFAVDGSRCSLPRTRQNAWRYSCKSRLSRSDQWRRTRSTRRRRQHARARQVNLPHVWLTMLWHVGSGLPWGWRGGPADSSERAHLKDMLAELPAGSLITADAGFVGYDVWNTLLDAGQHLLIRVGKNVRLLKKLGYARERAGYVYLWPDQKAKTNRPPLVLRLIVVQLGRCPMYLVTSVLSERELSDASAIEIYRRRWGIELFYRHYKQTFKRGKLRSHNPDNVMVELHWSLLGMWAMALHAHRGLLQQGVPPERVSFVGVLRAYRRPLREYKSIPDRNERLRDLLRDAVLDQYDRKDKRSRDYPRKKHEPAIQPPRIVIASRYQRDQAQIVKRHLKQRLTA
jgi:hypothetical protein